jgi:DNA-binding NarL/FixJ family response regulator
MVRVFHCDDSTSFRALLRAELEGDVDIEIVGDAGDLPAALDDLADADADVLLLDLLDIDRDVVAEVAEVAPGTRVVVLSGHPREYGLRMRPDAVDYIEKDAGIDILRETVLRVAAAG